MAYGRDEKFFQFFFLACKCANVSVGVMLRFILKFGSWGGGGFKEADIIALNSSSFHLPRRICRIRLISDHLT
jgi:hypothetical protein